MDNRLIILLVELLLVVFYCIGLTFSQEYSQDYINSLINQLKDDNTEFDAQVKLTKIGSDAVPELIDAAYSSNSKIKDAAIMILRDIHDKRAIDPLIDICLNDKDWRFRQNAEGALKSFGITREDAINISKNKQAPVAVSEGTQYTNNQAINNQATNNQANSGATEGNSKTYQSTNIQNNPSKSSNDNSFVYNIIYVILFILAICFLGNHYLRTRDDQEVLIHLPERPIILRDDEIDNPIIEDHPEFEVPGHDIKYIHNSQEIPDTAKCICRSHLRSSMNQCGGTIQCNHCQVFQHIECIKRWNGGRCIGEGCNRPLNLN